jgi:hypothetical protein
MVTTAVLNNLQKTSVNVSTVGNCAGMYKYVQLMKGSTLTRPLQFRIKFNAVLLVNTVSLFNFQTSYIGCCLITLKVQKPTPQLIIQQTP